MLPPIRVLIAEDRAADADLMVYELSRSGFEPKWTRVQTEEEYLKELQTGPDVVLADHTLPEFDAPRALELLKNSGLDIPLIVVTGSISEEVAVERIKQGASDYILKDRMARLGPAVKRALEEKKLRDEKRKAEELIHRNLKRIRALHEINVAITSTLDLRTVLNLLLEKIDALFTYPGVTTVRLFNKERGLLEPIACRNLDENEWRAERLGPGYGAAKTAFETKSPVLLQNVQADPQTRDTKFARKHGLVSRLVVPMIAKDERLGILSFYTKEEHEFTDEETEFLATLAGQAAIAIHNAQLYQQTSKQATELEKANAGLSRREEIQRLLKELSQDITVLDPTILLKKLADKIRQVINVDVVDVRIIESGKSQLVASSGIDPKMVDAAVSGDNRRWKWFVENRKPLIVSDIRKQEELFANATILHRLEIRGYLGIPLFFRNGEFIGTLRALTYQAREFSSEEVELLEQLANGAAVAVENARLYRDLEKSNKVKNEFLSVISHELRTPLSVVSGYTSLIKDGGFGEVNQEIKKTLSNVTSRTNDLMALVDSILEATTLETGEVSVAIEEVDLMDFMSNLKLIFDYPLNKEITVRWDYPPDLPATKTDAGKLRRILQNLISNAIKFTNRGSVTIAAQSVPEKQEMKFSVSDTGIGIPDEARGLIFEKFAQVDSSDSRLHEGIGLGLYIVKKFTELLGGTVGVKSELGKGSCFTVKIPALETSRRLRASERAEKDRSFRQSDKV